MLYRLGIFPLFLFSGAFFPISNLGPVLELVARLTPLWHGVNLSRMFTLDTVDWPLAALNVTYLVVLGLIGWRWSVAGPDEAAREVSAATTPTRPLTPLEATGVLVLRNYLVYRSAWKLFVTGFLEPVFYLLSIGDRRRPAGRRLRVQRPA